MCWVDRCRAREQAYGCLGLGKNRWGVSPNGCGVSFGYRVPLPDCATPTTAGGDRWSHPPHWGLGGQNTVTTGIVTQGLCPVYLQVSGGWKRPLLESYLTLAGITNDSDKVQEAQSSNGTQRIPSAFKITKIKPSSQNMRKQAKDNYNQSFISRRGQKNMSSQRALEQNRQRDLNRNWPLPTEELGLVHRNKSNRQVKRSIVQISYWYDCTRQNDKNSSQHRSN